MKSKKFWSNFGPSPVALPLFEQKICSICGENPGRAENEILWSGFIDCETDELICYKCKDKHYKNKLKNSNGEGIIYAEMPVYA